MRDFKRYGTEIWGETRRIKYFAVDEEEAGILIDVEPTEWPSAYGAKVPQGARVTGYSWMPERTSYLIYIAHLSFEERTRPGSTVPACARGPFVEGARG